MVGTLVYLTVLESVAEKETAKTIRTPAVMAIVHHANLGVNS